MAITYAVWRIQCDPKPGEDPAIQRFGQKYIDDNPIGSPMDLKLKTRPASTFATMQDLLTIDPGTDIEVPVVEAPTVI